MVLVAGKMLGLAAVLAIIFGSWLLPQMLGGTHAMAQQAAATTQPLTTSVQFTDPYVNRINTTWMLLGTFLVFGMQAGFTMLEAGFCRSRETVNVLDECVFDTCLCGILYWAWGYAFMFGAGNGLIGWHDPNDATKSWFFL